VDGERHGIAKQIEQACLETASTVEAALKPGARVSEVTEEGRRVVQASRLPGAGNALVFFHGLGLDHLDLDMAVGQERRDWTIEDRMVLAVHVLYPSDDRHRFYIEDTVVVGPDGATSLYAWSLDPIVGGGG
jgi:Xaa-Pro aminopeptidase